MFRVLTACLFAVALCLSAGCGSKESAAAPDPNQAVLEEVYGLIRLRLEQGKAPPQKAEDLLVYENAYPIGFAAVRSGDVVVSWGTQPASGSDAVLAYQKAVPADGGWVVLANGTAKKMTADEFKAAKMK